MRNVRTRRRGFLDLRYITIGDYIVLAASLMTVVSLFMTWFVSSITRTHGEWAFAYSQWASTVVMVFFFVTVFLVVYPAVAAELGLPPLLFSTALVFLSMGFILLLLLTYEFGKYDCISCQGGGTRGIGVWVALISSVVYILGAIIKWGSRPIRRRPEG